MDPDDHRCLIHGYSKQSNSDISLDILTIIFIYIPQSSMSDKQVTESIVYTKWEREIYAYLKCSSLRALGSENLLQTIAECHTCYNRLHKVGGGCIIL